MSSRRKFIHQSGIITKGILLTAMFGNRRQDPVDQFIVGKMEEHHIPGLLAGVVQGKELIWAKGFGWADIEFQKKMSAPTTIQNIGSISKTITATSVFQCWESGQLDLYRDINEYLDFPIRNPKHVSVPITPHQLLTHRSSIMDGQLYGESYQCGDPQVSLKNWLYDYFHGDHDQAKHFHNWKPGTKERLPFEPGNYSNIGFGVLGLIVETIAGYSFERYCQERIFSPLQMHATAWHIKDIDVDQHVTLYDYLDDNFKLPPGFTYDQLLPKYPEEKTPIKSGSFFPHCLYSFYNYPDGLLRTSIVDLANFLIAIMNGGTFDNFKLLSQQTIDTMLKAPLSNDPMQGLCWRKSIFPGKEVRWGHGGNDPGTNTLMYFIPAKDKGVLIFSNSTSGNIYEIMNFLFEYNFDKPELPKKTK